MIKLFKKFNDYRKSKLFNTREKVAAWLDSMRIENYTINDDLTVDVDWYVIIANKDLTEIPIQFGKVTRFFDCSKNNLTTLKGCPREVGEGYPGFDCSNNNLTSLEYCPMVVTGSFDCSRNKISTLKGCPKDIEIGGKISYLHNSLPFEVLSFHGILYLIRHHEEYGIWNTDGSFNQGRWKFFYNDYRSKILDKE